MNGLSLFLEVIVVVTVFVLNGIVLGKECTNIPTQLSSHTLRYEILSSQNETWKQEMFAHYHLIPTDDSAWYNLLPRKMLREEDEYTWAAMYRKLKHQTGSMLMGSDLLKEVSLHDVRLDENSMHGRAQKTNLEYLLMLDVDSLVWSFRKTAGLDTPGTAYGGWEAPTCELRGHFVGHYLSASALMWASTHDRSLGEKMSAVVSALSTCQEKMGSGYLSAFPSEQFDRFEAIKPVWAPYYTIHKIMAGLLDQYLLAGNNQALKMVMWMADYFYNRVQNVISLHTIERHWLSLNEETGGMNDVLYRLFTVTGDQKHLLLAHLFDKPCFLGLLAVKADDISGFHANTHIPVVIGAQMRYEVTGDPLYKEIGTFFMDIVNSSHSYATGGTSVSEFWSDPKRLASTLQNENEESCTTYNMLKVSRHLFRWTKETAYADYYERALTNGVLSIQRGTDPGVMIYMLPLGRGVSKAHTYHKWGTKNDSFWCCYGTGIESFSKLGDSIYFEEAGDIPGLYVIQYISSTLDWKSGRIVLTQKVDPVVSSDPYLRVTLTLSSKEDVSQTAALNLRMPIWTHSTGAKVSLNAHSLPPPSPGSFLSVTRKWGAGDTLTLNLPLSLRTEAIKDDRPQYASVQAILCGPFLLAGLTTGDWDLKTQSAASFSDWITPVPVSHNSQLISLSQESSGTSFVISNSNQSVTMEKLPESGTDASNHATFRLVLKDTDSSELTSPEDAIGKVVMLEPFDLPGMQLVHGGTGEGLRVADLDSDKGSSTFRVVAGLDRKSDTISLESEIKKGCYVYSGLDYKSGDAVKLECDGSALSTTSEFNKAISFVLSRGISEYHPISFVANGARRNFLLMPMLSLRDESYTTYFDIKD
ncbi:Beta-L-arabinofuranosidase [Dillenia turbinata]|uniref:Beta-L-arabinofuranosidase n=1 Tax=Dillenia turbinata TaxID=194707 RepID=A0AAN8Z5J8_9MAGN